MRSIASERNARFRFLLRSALLCAAWSAVAGACALTCQAAETSWQAGVAKVVITPGEPMPMAGYAGRDQPAEGKLTELWAKALVLQDPAGHQAVLITLDLIGIDRGLSQAICAQLQQTHGLTRDQIAINASHTHTGPVVAKNLRPMHYLLLSEAQQQQVDAYAALLEKKIAQVVAAASKHLAPCRISTGSGYCTVAVNRRNNDQGRVPELRRLGRLRGPVDYDVPVLAVRSSKGELRAVVFGYACHATVLSSLQFSGDYPGFAQMAVEEAHPGCVVMFWAGCGGDQNPLPRRTLELAQQHGRRLAAAVDEVLRGILVPLDGRLQTGYREIDLPLGTLPTAAELRRDAKSSNRFVASRASALLAQIEAGRPLNKTYPYPIGVWRLGEQVEWVFLGGEVVVDFAIRLKSEMSGSRTWVAGYSNDVMAYIPSRRVLNEGGYEGGGAMVYYGLPTVWAPQVETDIVTAVHQIAGTKQSDRK